jgi:hypothetical protein
LLRDTALRTKINIYFNSKGVFAVSTLTEEIIHDLAELPTEMQMETLDFIRFLKIKWVNQHALQTEAAE